MADQHRPGRAIGEQVAGLVLGKVMAPGAEGRHGYAAAEAEEGDASDGDAGTVQNVRVGPAGTCLDQLTSRFIVPRDQDRRLLDRPEDVETAIEPVSHVGEVTGTYQNIDAG